MEEDKQLASKAILLQGRKYVQVVDRINYFNDNFKNGSIRTRLISEPASTHYVVEAKVIPDVTVPERYFSGLSQAKLGDPGANKDAALENAETSAIGRALGMMGIGVIDSVASVDEMNKAGVGSQNRSTATKPQESTTTPQIKDPSAPATPNQVNAIYKMAKHKGVTLDKLIERFSITTIESATKGQASDIINYLQG